jgi:hypothetical protein
MVMTEDEHSQLKFEAQTDAPLRGLLDRVEDIAGGQTVDLKTVIEALGNRAFGPVLLLCGLFLLTPLGILPGVPIALGVIVMLFSVQLLFRRKSPWMPKFLRRVKITAASLEKTRKVAGPWLDRIDNVVRPRFQWAARGPMLVLAALIAMLLATTMLPLGAVPFGVVVPGFIIGLMGLGITGRDGFFILLGLALSFAVPIMILQMLV